jgi:hypothetical protein
MVTSLFLSVFKCSDRDEVTGLKYDTYRLDMDMQISCMGEHLNWLGFSLAGILVWSFGIPVFFWYLLMDTQKPGSHNTLHSPSILRKFGFLYVGFESNCYYQEMIYMMRKVLFLICESFSWMSTPQRTVILLVMTCANLGMHLTYSPYDNRAYFGLDKLETNTSACLVLLLVGRLMQIVLETIQASENNPGEDGGLEDVGQSVIDKTSFYYYLPGLLMLTLVFARSLYLLIRSSLWPVDGSPMLPEQMLRLVEERLVLTLKPPSVEELAAGYTIEHVMLSHQLGRGLDEVFLDKSFSARRLAESERNLLKTTCAEIMELVICRHEICLGEAPTQMCIPMLVTQFERILVGCVCQALRSRVLGALRNEERDTISKKIVGAVEDTKEYVHSLLFGGSEESPQNHEEAHVDEEMSKLYEETCVRPVSAEELHVALMTLTPRLLDKRTNLRESLLRKLCTNTKHLLSFVSDVDELFSEHRFEHRFKWLRPQCSSGLDINEVKPQLPSDNPDDSSIRAEPPVAASSNASSRDMPQSSFLGKKLDDWQDCREGEEDADAATTVSARGATVAAAEIAAATAAPAEVAPAEVQLMEISGEMQTCKDRGTRILRL